MHSHYLSLRARISFVVQKEWVSCCLTLGTFLKLLDRGLVVLTLGNFVSGARDLVCMCGTQATLLYG